MKSVVKRKPFNMTLDEELMREAKKMAIDQGQHLYEFVEAAVRKALDTETADSGTVDKAHKNVMHG